MSDNTSPDMSNLARMMLEWEMYKWRMDELEGAIRDTVMQVGKTQTVGNVRASYSQGRKKFNYEKAAELAELPNDVWNALYTDYTRTAIDWRGFCKDSRASISIENIPFTQNAPGVTVRLI